MDGVIREYYFYLEKNNLTNLIFLKENHFLNLKSIKCKEDLFYLFDFLYEDNESDFFNSFYNEDLILFQTENNILVPEKTNLETTINDEFTSGNNLIDINCKIFFSDNSLYSIPKDIINLKIKKFENSFSIADSYCQSLDLNYSLYSVDIIENITDNKHSIDFVYVAQLDLINPNEFFYYNSIDLNAIKEEDVKAYISFLKHSLSYSIDKDFNAVIINVIKLLSK